MSCARPRGPQAQPHRSSSCHYLPRCSSSSYSGQYGAQRNRGQLMSVTVHFDPLATLIAAFEALWPGKACELAIAPFAADDQARARLGVPDEARDPLIVLVN